MSSHDTRPDEAVAPSGGRSHANLLVRGAVSVVIVVGIFVGVLPRIADYSDVWATITAMTWLETTSLLVIAIWNVVTYWFVMVAAMPGLGYRQAAVVNQASTAISNTLPGGGAIGVAVTYSMYTSWGFSRGQITRSVLVSGVWNTFMKLGLPLVALALLAIAGDVSPALVVASILGVGVLVAVIVAFSLILRSDALARRVGGLLGRIVSRVLALVRRPQRTGWGEAAATFRTDTVDLLRSHWFGLTFASLVSHLSLFVVLLTGLRHVGIAEEDLSWITVLAAYAFVRLISALPITPGGVGVVELGYVAALTVGFDDAQSAKVVAAVLVFRFLTYFLPIPAGVGAYGFWRANRSWRKPVRDSVET